MELKDFDKLKISQYPDGGEIILSCNPSGNLLKLTFVKGDKEFVYYQNGAGLILSIIEHENFNQQIQHVYGKEPPEVFTIAESVEKGLGILVS